MCVSSLQVARELSSAVLQGLEAASSTQSFLFPVLESAEKKGFLKNPSLTEVRADCQWPSKA